MSQPTTVPPDPNRAAVRERVAQLRRQHPLMPLTTALRRARLDLAPAPPTRFGFLAGFAEGCPVTAAVDGFTVSVRTELDPDTRCGDDDVTGWFTDRYEAGCVPNPDPTARKWYRPSNVTIGRTLNELRRAGMSKSVALDTYRQIVRQEMHLDAIGYYVGVVVTVSLNGHHLADSSLWAIGVNREHDSTAYLVEVAEECIYEAMEHASGKPRAYLRTLRSRPAAATTVTVTEPDPAPASVRRSGPAITALPDGDLRIFEPDPEACDHSRMYVLDVLGLNLLVYVKDDGSTYVHIDESDSRQAHSLPLLVEVFNGGENQYGPDAPETNTEEPPESLDD